MQSLIKTIIALLCLASICTAQTGTGKDDAAELNKRHLNETLILRHPLTDNSQVYNSTGELLSHGHEGPWTVYGGVKITAIRFTGQELRIEGDRLNFQFDPKQQALSPQKTKGKRLQSIQIAVKLSESVLSVEQGEAVFAKIFAMTDDDVIQSAPEFWKPYLTKRAALKKGSEAAKAGSESPARKKDVVLTLGDGITPPRAIHTPEPSFSEIAKEGKYQGVVTLVAVIDETGRVVDPYIKRPLGMGLDEMAIEVMQRWRFKPAQRNGKPVAVEMALEISFNLY